MDAEKAQKRSVKSLKASVAGKNKYLDKLMSDSHFRIRMSAALGGGWNFIYALGSMFGLERMMLGTFGDAESQSTLIVEAA